MDMPTENLSEREMGIMMEMQACKLLLNNIFPQPVWEHLLVRYRDLVKATSQAQGRLPHLNSLHTTLSSLPLTIISPASSLSPSSSTPPYTPTAGAAAAFGARGQMAALSLSGQSSLMDPSAVVGMGPGAQGGPAPQFHPFPAQLQPQQFSSVHGFEGGPSGAPLGPSQGPWRGVQAPVPGLQFGQASSSMGPASQDGSENLATPFRKSSIVRGPSILGERPDSSAQQGGPWAGPLGTVSDDSAITGTGAGHSQRAFKGTQVAAGCMRSSKSGISMKDSARDAVEVDEACCGACKGQQSGFEGPGASEGLCMDPLLFRQQQRGAEFQAWQRGELVNMHALGSAMCGISMFLGMLLLVPGGPRALWALQPADSAILRFWAFGSVMLMLALPITRCILGDAKYMVVADFAAAMVRLAVTVATLAHRHMVQRFYMHTGHSWPVAYLQACSTLLCPSLRLRTSARTDRWLQPLCLLLTLYSTAMLYANPKSAPIMPSSLPLYLLLTTVMALVPIVFSRTREHGARVRFEVQKRQRAQYEDNSSRGVQAHVVQAREGIYKQYTRKCC